MAGASVGPFVCLVDTSGITKGGQGWAPPRGAIEATKKLAIQGHDRQKSGDSTSSSGNFF